MLRFATARPRHVLVLALVCTTVCCLLIPGLNTDQRFNQELPETHPVNRGQQILERDFGGFLGPEISIRRKDRASIVDDESLRQLDGFVKALRELPETEHVWSVRDILPRQIPESEKSAAISIMREDPVITLHVRELINEAQDRLAVIVRIGDVGTRRAGNYHATIKRLAIDLWGPAFEVEVVGQWWLAQHGMRLLLRDMLTSFATAIFIVMPLLWLALRERRLFIAASIANVLPLLLPLAFMAATGITLRIGTAVVLAIALGIAVDNTLHIILRLRRQLSDDGDMMTEVSNALHSTGRAVTPQGAESGNRALSDSRVPASSKKAVRRAISNILNGSPVSLKATGCSASPVISWLAKVGIMRGRICTNAHFKSSQSG